MGPYEVMGLLGEGRTGRTYLGRSADGVLVAVKVVHGRLAQDPGVRERLRQGVDAARRVSGARFVPLADADLDAPNPWLASRLAQEPSLAEVVTESGPLPTDGVRRLGAGLVAALARLHGDGLPHGALKPANVVQGQEDRPRVVDFGIAGALEGPGAGADFAVPVRDMGFLCPEQLLGNPLTPASDVHALAALLVFAATGTPPFRVEAGGNARAEVSAFQRATAYQHIVRGAPDLSGVNDPELRALLAECLAKDPAERPTLDHVAERLGTAELERPETHPLASPQSPPPSPPQAERPTGPAPAPAPPPVHVPAAPLPPPPAIPPAPPPYPPPPYAPPAHERRRRKGWLLLLAAAGAVVALLVAVWGPFGSFPLGAPAGGAEQGKNGFAWAVTNDGDTSYVGQWSSPSGVVLGTDTGLTAYDGAHGTVLWTWRPPDGGILCNMSQSTSQGVGAFTYGVFNSKVGIEQCDHLQTIAVASGAPGWKQPVSLVAQGARGFPDLTGGTSLSINDGVVSAAYVGNRTTTDHGTTDLLSADAGTGKVRWNTDTGGAPLLGGCKLTGHAQVLRGTVYAIGECGGSSSALLAFPDPTSPVAHPSAVLPGCRDISNKTLSAMMAVSAEHLLVGCELTYPEQGRLYTVTSSGTVLPVDLAGAAATIVGYDYGGSHPPENLLMSGDTLYVLHGENVVTGGANDGVVAIDLTTGHHLWDSTVPGASTAGLLAPAGQGVAFLAGQGSAPPSVYTANGAGPATMTHTLNGAEAAVFAKTGPTRPYYGVRAGGDRVAVGFSDSLEAGTTVMAALPDVPGGE